jgi:hemerythrin
MRTQAIRWRPGMVVDGGIIDDDHRHLIDIINSYSYHRARGRAALPQAIDCLNALKFYAESHFVREERLQQLVSYPDHSRQHAEHRELMASLDGMIWRAERTLTAADAIGLVEDLGTLLRRWLLNHIITLDLRMKPYAAAINSHAADLPPLKSVPRER